MKVVALATHGGPTAVINLRLPPTTSSWPELPTAAPARKRAITKGAQSLNQAVVAAELRGSAMSATDSTSSRIQSQPPSTSRARAAKTATISATRSLAVVRSPSDVVVNAQYTIASPS